MEDTGQNGNGKENEKQPINSPPENNNNPRQPPPSQPPQQCPRCDSFNTKFCYYNNYSLSQPRYFCKSCRRYWTQGGTLRNVPVGGGCRKGAKRLVKSGLPSGGASCSSSFIGDCSRSVQEQVQQQQPPPLPLPPPPLPPLHLPQMRGYSNMGLPYANSFYSPSGILSSVTAMQNLNRPIGFNQVPLNGGGVGGIPGGNSANYSVLQGFSGNQNMIRASQVVQQQIYRPQDPQMMVNPNQNRILGGSWTQGYINHNNPSGSNTSNVSWAQSMLLQTNNNMNGPDSAMNNPNQWPDDDDEDDHLPGYGPPPSSS